MTTTQDTNALVKRLLALANCEANELADALTEAATTLGALLAENDKLKHEAMFDQHYTDPEDLMFVGIERAARTSYNRARSQVCGQIPSRADDFEAHLVWAAQAYKKAEIDQLRGERDALQARLDDAGRQEPVAWVNQANLISAAIQRSRGGKGDLHSWSETPTAYHSVSLYPAPQAAAPQPLSDKQIVDAIEPLYQNRAVAEMAAKVGMDDYRAVIAEFCRVNGIGAKP